MQRDFFATQTDLEQWCRRVESSRPVAYVLCGLFQDAVPRIYHGVSEIPDLGVMIADNEALADQYLVVPAKLQINIRQVPQVAGGVRYAIDQLQNPESIILQPAGLHQQHALICGHVGGSSKHETAKELFREFCEGMRICFIKHREYFVGRDARRLGLEGVRLVTRHVHQDAAYDLELNR